MVGGLADFTLTGQKHQDVTRAVRAEPQLVHRIGYRVVQVVVTGLLKGSVPLLDRKHAPGHHDDRCRPFSPRKVIRKPLRIDRCRRDDDLQVWPTRQQLAQVTQQEVDVQAALVRLVNDEGVVGVQQRVGLGFRQQNTVGHQLDGRIPAQAVLKPHLEAHHVTERGFQLLGNAFGHAAGRNAARLGMANHLGALTRGVVELAAPHAEGDFGQLRGFARTGFTTHDDHLVDGNGGSDFIAFARNRQRLRKRDGEGRYKGLQQDKPEGETSKKKAPDPVARRHAGLSVLRPHQRADRGAPTISPRSSSYQATRLGKLQAVRDMPRTIATALAARASTRQTRCTPTPMSASQRVW